MTRLGLRVVCIAAALTLLGLAAVGTGQPSNVGVTPVTDDDLPADLVGDRCAAHEMNIPVQELHLSGTELHLSGTRGGLAVGPILYRDLPGDQDDLPLQRLTVAQALAAAGVPFSRPFLHNQVMQRDVVIIVADDFASNTFQLPVDLNGPGVSALTLQRIEDLILTGELSHGALVVHHLNVAIASLTFARGENEPPQPMFQLELTDTAVGRWVWVQQGTGRRLIVRALDLTEVAGGPEITVESVWTALRTQVAALVSDEFLDNEPSSVVLNMSWVFLPCKTIQEFLQNAFRFKSFADYLGGVGVDLNTFPIESVIARLGEVDDGRLLGILLPERIPAMFGADKVTLVAASGNFSMPYQMLPAGWDVVVGVAVEDTGFPEPPRYSNIGDVTTPLESFVFERLNADGVRVGETDITYGGTSFTAPLVSLYAALDIASTSSYCSDSLDPPELSWLGFQLGVMDVRIVNAIENCP